MKQKILNINSYKDYPRLYGRVQNLLWHRKHAVKLTCGHVKFYSASKLPKRYANCTQCDDIKREKERKFCKDCNREIHGFSCYVEEYPESNFCEACATNYLDDCDR